MTTEDELFTPGPGDGDPWGEDEMQQGKGPENDLRDPWFHTDEGRRWLAEQAEAAGPPGLAGF